MARIGHAAGWRVVVVTVIARANYFSDEAHQRQFAANRDALNEVLRHSTEFDGVADPAVILDDGGNGAYYWDGCHVLPSGYQVVADLVEARGIGHVELRVLRV